MITTTDKAGVAAAQSMIQPFGKVLKPLMIKNGWQKSSPVPPQFMWEGSGHVYVSGYSKESFKEILDMLRSGDQSMQASTPQTSPKPPDNVGANTNGVGPDVLGLRIGTTPEAARTIFKSRILVSDNYKKNYRELFTMLTYNIPAQGVSGPVGEYLSRLQVPDLYVLFTPLPKHEGIVSIRRLVDFPDGKKPTYDSFEKTLAEKYGTPTYYEVGLSVWIYDSNGTLQKHRNKEEMLSCQNKVQQLLAGGGSDWALNYDPNMFGVPVEQCGAVFFSVALKNNMYSKGGGTAVVDGHDTCLVGFDAAIHASKEARALIDRAAAVAGEAAIKKAQQQKPDL
jgi:hypothetical protein